MQIQSNIYKYIHSNNYILKNSFLRSCLVRSKYAMRKINSTAIQQHFLQSKASCETVFFYKIGKLDQDGPRLTNGSFSHSMFLVAFLLLSCHLANINFCLEISVFLFFLDISSRHVYGAYSNTVYTCVCYILKYVRKCSKNLEHCHFQSLLRQLSPSCQL